MEVISEARVLPLLTVDDPRSAYEFGSVLLEGGLRVLEVAFRTPNAVSAVQELARHSELCIGAGTVVAPEQVDDALKAGAQFIVTPGFSPDVVDRCRQNSISVFPGVATATEIMAAKAMGITVMKFFPAESLGGVATLAALAGPFPQVRFIPTGGVNSTNAASYLRHPSVIAVGGSWMAPRALI